MEGEIFDEMVDNLSLQAQEEELKNIMKILDNLNDGYKILKENNIFSINWL